MDRISLKVTPRTTVGKKVKQLRKQGFVPAHIYGYKTEPINISVDKEQIHETYRHSGETGLVDLQLEGQTLPVLIKDIQTHAISGDFLNVDFYKVNLKEKVTVTVEIIAEGTEDAPAVANGVGIIEQPLQEVEIEALPTDLIERITVDVSGLAEIDQAIYVSDLQVPETVTILAEPEEIVFKVGELSMPEPEEEAPTEGEEGAEAGEATAEGEESAESESQSEDAAEA